VTFQSEPPQGGFFVVCASPGVAGVHGDEIRSHDIHAFNGNTRGGFLVSSDNGDTRLSSSSSGNLLTYYGVGKYIGGNATKVRSYGVNGCVWLGLAS